MQRKTLPPAGAEAVPSEKQVSTGSVSPPVARGTGLSHWLQSVRCDPLLNLRSTPDLPEHADIVVIGSGLTGSLTALRLLESDNPPQSIILLEAREFCSGATGRNAGHCKPDTWRGFAEYSDRFGAQQALEILRNEQETWQEVVKYIKTYGVDCDLWTGDTLDVLMTDTSALQATTTMKDFLSAGGNGSQIRVINDASEAERISRVKGAKAVYSWPASTLHPWKLTAHIARRGLDLGLNLQTFTPVTDVCKRGRKELWNVVTPRGSIRSPTVIHATNGFAAALLPEMKGVINPVPHMCNKIIPPLSHSGSLALKNSAAIIFDQNMMTINPRFGSDGVVLFGGYPPGIEKLHQYIADNPSLRSTDDSLLNFQPITESALEFARSGLGWSEENGTSRPFLDLAWSGILGESRDTLPLIGKVPGKAGQWICSGHHGHGLARIFTAVPGLIRLIHGGDWSSTGLPQAFELTLDRLKDLRLPGVRSNDALAFSFYASRCADCPKGDDVLKWRHRAGLIEY